jgi:hypothetical protein
MLVLSTFITCAPNSVANLKLLIKCRCLSNAILSALSAWVFVHITHTIYYGNSWLIWSCFTNDRFGRFFIAADTSQKSFMPYRIRLLTLLLSTFRSTWEATSLRANSLSCKI